MAARYTEVTLEDMTRALKRRFRSYRPRQSTVQREVVFDLKIDDHVAVRVWSSIVPGRDVGKGVGQDAIRIQLVSLQKGVPLQRGKAPIVKRTQNWAENLERRVNEAVLVYNDSADFWAGLARKKDGVQQVVREEATPPEGDAPKKPRYAPPDVSDKQVNLLVRLIRPVRRAGQFDALAERFGLPVEGLTKGHLRTILTGGRGGTASELIGLLFEIEKGLRSRQAAVEASEPLGCGEGDGCGGGCDKDEAGGTWAEDEDGGTWAEGNPKATEEGHA